MLYKNTGIVTEIAISIYYVNQEVTNQMQDKLDAHFVNEGNYFSQWKLNLLFLSKYSSQPGQANCTECAAGFVARVENRQIYIKFRTYYNVR